MPGLSFTLFPRLIFQDRMLYMDNITDAQGVSVPLNGTVPSGVPELVIRSTVDLSEYAVTVNEYVPGITYASMSVMLPEGIPDGSYEYRLSVGDAAVSQGCLQIGGYDCTRKEYDKEITYRQYGG